MPPPKLFADDAITFADLAAQLDAVGGVPPAATMRELAWAWVPVIRSLVLDDLDVSFSYPDEWRDVFGWGFDQVDQYVGLQANHERIVLLRGRFDPAELQAARQAGGAQQILAPGGVAPDGAEVFGPSQYPSGAGTPAVPSRIVQIVSMGFETSAVLPGGIVVYTASSDAMRQVLATAAGQEPALVDQAGVSELLATGGELASARVMPGLSLANQGPGATAVFAYPATPGTPITRAQFDAAMATAQAEGTRVEEEQRRMPEITHALLGITPGGPLPIGSPDDATPVPAAVSGIPDAEFRFVLRFASADDAATAVGVIEDRLARGQSDVYQIAWSDLFREWSVAASPVDARMVLARIRPDGWRTNAWIALYERGDLTFWAGNGDTPRPAGAAVAARGKTDRDVRRECPGPPGGQERRARRAAECPGDLGDGVGGSEIEHGAPQRGDLRVGRIGGTPARRADRCTGNVRAGESVRPAWPCRRCSAGRW